MLIRLDAPCLCPYTVARVASNQARRTATGAPTGSPVPCAMAWAAGGRGLRAVAHSFDQTRTHDRLRLMQNPYRNPSMKPEVTVVKQTLVYHFHMPEASAAPPKPPTKSKSRFARAPMDANGTVRRAILPVCMHACFATATQGKRAVEAAGAKAAVEMGCRYSLKSMQIAKRATKNAMKACVHGASRAKRCNRTTPEDCTTKHVFPLL